MFGHRIFRTGDYEIFVVAEPNAVQEKGNDTVHHAYAFSAPH